MVPSRFIALQGHWVIVITPKHRNLRKQTNLDYGQFLVLLAGSFVTRHLYCVASEIGNLRSLLPGWDASFLQIPRNTLGQNDWLYVPCGRGTAPLLILLEGWQRSLALAASMACDMAIEFRTDIFAHLTKIGSDEMRVTRGNALGNYNRYRQHNRCTSRDWTGILEYSKQKVVLNIDRIAPAISLRCRW